MKSVLFSAVTILTAVTFSTSSSLYKLVKNDFEIKNKPSLLTKECPRHSYLLKAHGFEGHIIMRISEEIFSSPRLCVELENQF